jgi:hypothetical protein
MNAYLFVVTVIFAFAVLPTLLIWFVVRLTEKSDVARIHDPHGSGNHQPHPGAISGRLRKFMSSLQLLGGSVLLLSMAHDLYTMPQTHNLLSIGLYVIFILFCVAAIAYGLLLWRGIESSRLPSAVIWLVQSPFVISSPISYSFVLGLAVQLQFVATPRGSAFTVNFPFLEQHILYFAGQQPNFAIGINVFAAYCCYRLFSGKIAINPQPCVVADTPVMQA